VEAIPVVGCQGAQAPKTQGVRLLEEAFAALFCPAPDPGQRGVDGGKLFLCARRVVRVVVSRVADDVGHEAVDEFDGGLSGRVLAELLTGKVECLSVPRRPVREDCETERTDPVLWGHPVLGVVLVARLIAHPEVHVIESDLEGNVRVVRRVCDGSGCGLGGVLEDGLGLRAVEDGCLDGESAQIVEELLREPQPFARDHPVTPRHGPNQPPDPIREVHARCRDHCLADLVTHYPHCPLLDHLPEFQP
jgi:hypothetical protein